MTSARDFLISSPAVRNRGRPVDDMSGGDVLSLAYT